MTTKYSYTHLLLHGYDLKKVYYGMGSGLRQNLDFSDFKRLPILVPTDTEQSKIHKYVESINAQVSKFIRNRRRLIELLKEQKQNVINQAVTRGLDPEVRLKPSGVEWIGDIPEHWEVRRVKHLCEKIVDCKNRTPPDGKENEYRVVRTSDVKDGKLLNNDITWTTEEGHKLWTQRGAPKAGDIFLLAKRLVARHASFQKMKSCAWDSG